MARKDFHRWLEEKAKTLTPSELRLVSHMREHPDLWAFKSASHLASLLGMHRSTIIRFAQNLGMDGFRELQSAARTAFLHSYSPAPELVLTGHDESSDREVQEIFDRELMNLRQTYEYLDPAVLEETAERLARADRVLLFGRRFSYPIALHLSMALGSIRDGVRLAPEPGGASIHSLFDLTPEDFALIVSLRRHSHEVRRTYLFLEEAGVPQALLTDVSPLVDLPEKIQVIQAHVGSAGILDSYTALVSVGHILLHMVSKLLPDSKARLVQVEQCWNRFNEIG